MKRSDLYLTAQLAVERALPEESREWIEAHDRLHREWRLAGWPSPVPAALTAAAAAVEADPLASVALELRMKANSESALEYQREFQGAVELAKREERVGA